MTAAAHTPGPWAWDEPGYVLRPAAPKTAIGTICILESGCRVFRHDNLDLDAVDREHAANMRLIAAAPDLLAVVQELEESAGYWSEYDVPIGIVDRIRAALALATGEGATQ